MTNLFLFEAMSEIDFDLIERAEAPVPLRKKPIFRVALIAASLALTLTVCSVSAGVAGTVAVGVQYEQYVAQNYPEYDGTLLHFAQILLTEDENVLSSLLDDDLKHALGGAIAALRENWGGIGGEQSKESTEESEEPEEETSGQESETETEPEITDEKPEQGWSEGLQYDMKSQNGETVYVVSGIGICKDTDVYIPPTYRGYPVVAIGKEAFFNVLIDFVSVPSTVKEIGEYAFFNCSVKRVELSEGVEVIGDSAFADAYYLEEINFPSTLKTIGSYAFCATDLTQVILPDSVTEVHGHAFTSCLHVTEIRLSANLTEIKAYMLEGVHNVKSIELPRGIERIGEWAFMQCSRLETVTLYHGVLQIDDNIFEYCEDIKEIRFVGTQAEWESIDMSKKTREQLTPLVVYVEE